MKINIIFHSIYLAVENGDSGGSYCKLGTLVKSSHLHLDRFQSFYLKRIWRNRRGLLEMLCCTARPIAGWAQPNVGTGLQAPRQLIRELMLVNWKSHTWKKQGSKCYCKSDLQKLSTPRRQRFNGLSYLFTYAVITESKKKIMLRSHLGAKIQISQNM